MHTSGHLLRLWVIVAVARLDSRFSAAPGKLLQDVVVSNYDCGKKQDDRQIVHGHQDCTKVLPMDTAKKGEKLS